MLHFNNQVDQKKSISQTARSLGDREDFGLEISDRLSRECQCTALAFQTVCWHSVSMQVLCFRKKKDLFIYFLGRNREGEKQRHTSSAVRFPNVLQSWAQCRRKPGVMNLIRLSHVVCQASCLSGGWIRKPAGSRAGLGPVPFDTWASQGVTPHCATEPASESFFVL